MKRLGIPHVEYSLTWDGDKPLSACEDFITADTDLVSAWQISVTQKRPNHLSQYEHFLNCCSRLGIPNVQQWLDQMLVLDYLIANTDRHFKNFGAIRNASTLEWISPAPLFDSGTSMWHNQLSGRIKPDAPTESKPFRKTHAGQIQLVASFDWVDFAALHGLEEEYSEILKASTYIDDERRDALCSALATRHTQLAQQWGAHKTAFDCIPILTKPLFEGLNDRLLVPVHTDPFAVERHEYLAGLRKYLVDTPAQQPINSISCLARVSHHSTKLLRSSWRDCCTVGSARDVPLMDVQQRLACFQKDIGFSYLRLQDVFSDELRVVSTGADGNLVFSFTYLDKILDAVTQLGLKPFIQLGYMPAVLALNPSKRMLCFCVSPPKSTEQWCLLVQAFVLHCIKRYGLTAVGTWLFSVLNQPDTPIEMYGFDSDSDFLHFYTSTSKH